MKVVIGSTSTFWTIFVHDRRIWLQVELCYVVLLCHDEISVASKHETWWLFTFLELSCWPFSWLHPVANDPTLLGCHSCSSSGLCFPVQRKLGCSRWLGAWQRTTPDVPLNGPICELLEKASEIGVSEIKSPVGRVFQKYVYTCLSKWGSILDLLVQFGLGIMCQEGFQVKNFEFWGFLVQKV